MIGRKKLSVKIAVFNELVQYGVQMRIGLRFHQYYVVCCLQKVMYSHQSLSFSGFIFIFLLTPNLEDWRMTQA